MFQKHARLFLSIAYSVCDGTSANNERIQDLNSNACTRVSSHYDRSWWQEDRSGWWGGGGGEGCVEFAALNPESVAQIHIRFN